MASVTQSLRPACSLSWLIVALLLWQGVALGQENLVVYSGRKERAIRPVIEAFQQTRGIKVQLKVGKTSGLANELIQERNNPRADIFISTVAGVMEILAEREVLTPYLSPNASAVPAEYKSKRGFWTGISGRARVIIYNQKLVSKEEVPKSIFELTDPKWRKRIAIAGTRERTTLAWVSSLVAAKGRGSTKEFVGALVANEITILPDNTNVWRGVGKGEFALGLTNSPNYQLARAAGYPVGVVYPDQGPGMIGVLVNPNAVAIVKGAKNLGAAQRFVDYILSQNAQRLLIEQAYEMPLVPGVTSGEIEGLATLSQTRVTQERLAQLADDSLTLLADTSSRW